MKNEPRLDYAGNGWTGNGVAEIQSKIKIITLTGTEVDDRVFELVAATISTCFIDFT